MLGLLCSRDDFETIWDVTVHLTDANGIITLNFTIEWESLGVEWKPPVRKKILIGYRHGNIVK